MANKQLTAKVKLNISDAENKLKRLNTLFRNLDKVSNSVGSNKKIEQQLNKSQSKIQNIVSKVKQWANAQHNVTKATKSTNSTLSSVGNKLKRIASTYLGIMGAKAGLNVADTITSAQNKLNYTTAKQLGVSGVNSDGSYSNKTFMKTQDAMDKMYKSSQKVRMSYTDMMSNVSKSMALAGDSFQNNTDRAIRFQEIMAEAYAIGGASAAEMSSSMYQMIQALGAGTLAGDELRSVREGAPLAYKAIEDFVQGVYNCEDSLKDLASQGKVTSDMVVEAIMNAGNEMDSAFAQTKQTFAQTWEQIKNAAKRAFSPLAEMLTEMLNKAIDNGLIKKIENFFTVVAKAVMIVFKIVKNVYNWIVDNWDWIESVLLGGLSLLLTYLGYLALKAIATAIAWAVVHWQLLIILTVIFLLVYSLEQWRRGLKSTAEMIEAIAGVIIMLLIMIGVMTGNVVILIIALVLAVALVVFHFLEEVTGAAWVVASFIKNLVQSLLNIIMTVLLLILVTIVNVIAFIINCVAVCVQVIITIIQWVVAAIVNFVVALANVIATIGQNLVADIVNGATALWNAISAICTNIGIAFQNAWNGALSAFYNFLAGCLDGLKSLEGPLNAIAGLFGKGGISISGLSSSLRTKANSYQQQDYVSVSDAWTSGLNTRERKSYKDAWTSGWNTMQFRDMGDAITSGWNLFDYASWEGAIEAGSSAFGTGLSDWNPSEVYKNGAEYGANVKQSIEDWGSGLRDSFNEKLGLDGDKSLLGNLGDALGLGSDSGEGGWLDNLGKALGLDFGDAFGDGSGSGLNTGTPKSVEDLIKDALGDDIGDISGNTGDIADTLDLAEEDLDYLRKIADMEWKKEFTTANITVDMSNYNTINGDNDLDGIVTRLADKLYEEMNVVANGVYA